MDYSTISVSGSDRIEFLQGQLTHDVASVTDSHGIAAAWCSAKGRVIVTCRVFAQEDSVFVVVPAASAAAVLQRLTLYRLRADVHLELSDDHVFAAFPATTKVATTPKVAVIATPFTTSFTEWFASPGSLADASIDLGQALSEEAWARARCAAGLVDITPESTEQYTPHMLNLDLVGAVSFNKGCYTGQEIVARTQHLGKVKRRINRYLIDGGELQVGDTVMLGDREVGKIVNTSAAEALAVVPVEQHRETVYSGSIRLTPARLPYSI